jgi:hypothetical protein
VGTAISHSYFVPTRAATALRFVELGTAGLQPFNHVVWGPFRRAALKRRRCIIFDQLDFARRMLTFQDCCQG